MITSSLLQHYWWCLVSLLGALLVFLLFVQGGNSLLFRMGRNEDERVLLINSTGRKWEFTFTMLVTFGGAFFASFPLFYSTSFGGAYWLWMLILVSFILQAVAYEFQSKEGNWLGKHTYRRFLVLNGVMGPVLLGVAVATFYNGAAFVVEKDAMTNEMMPVISRWANGWHGLDALADPWNLVLGFAVFFLSRVLGGLYFINNIAEHGLVQRCRRQLWIDFVPFLLLFLAFAVRLLLKGGWMTVAYSDDLVLVPYAYFNSLLDSPWLLVLLLAGVAGVLYGTLRSALSTTYVRGIWMAGGGTVLTVFALLVLVGWNGMAYYPSAVEAQSSLTVANSSSSEFTLRVMSVVSLLIPFVLAYIAYAWHAIDRKSLTHDELKDNDHTY